MGLCSKPDVFVSAASTQTQTLPLDAHFAVTVHSHGVGSSVDERLGGLGKEIGIGSSEEGIDQSVSHWAGRLSQVM